MIIERVDIERNERVNNRRETSELMIEERSNRDSGWKRGGMSESERHKKTATSPSGGPCSKTLLILTLTQVDSESTEHSTILENEYRKWLLPIRFLEKK